MMGRNHVVVNVFVLGGILSCAGAAAISGSPLVVAGKEALGFLSSARYNDFPFPDTHMKIRVYILLLAYVLGSLFPDIDSRDSIVGRYFKLPMEHRTWTHSIWAVIVFVAGSITNVFVSWFTFGYILHLLFDSVSAGGICFWYPMQRFRKYGNGACVAKGHRIKLYRAGRMSEGVFAALICMLSLFLMFWFGFYRFTGFQFAVAALLNPDLVA